MDCRTTFERLIVGSADVLKVTGELDVYSATPFTKALRNASLNARLIIDLDKCRYADASAIAALVRARKEYAGEIVLVVADRSIVQRVLSITNVDQLFPIFTTLKAAIGYARAGNGRHPPVTYRPQSPARGDRAGRLRR